MGYVAWDGTYRQRPLDLTRHGSSGCDCLECHRDEVQRRRKRTVATSLPMICSRCGGPIDREAIELGIVEDHDEVCRYCAEIGFRTEVRTSWGTLVVARRGSQDAHGYWTYRTYVWPPVVVPGASEDRIELPDDKSIEWAAEYFYAKSLRQSLDGTTATCGIAWST